MGSYLFIYKIRKFVLALFVVSALMADAQGFVSPKVRLVKQRYEKQVSKAFTRGQAVGDQKRGRFFVTCEKEADAHSVADVLKAKGAGIRIVKGQQILLDMPFTRLEDIADTKGVARVDVGPRVVKKTDNTRRVTQTIEANDGAAPLPQAYTGKGVIVGIMDNGFDVTHPMFKDKEGNLRIKGYYMPGNSNFGGDSVRINGKTLTGSYYYKPEDLLDTLKVKGLKNSPHGTHCISIAAGSVMDDVKGVGGEPLGGMAPEADILLCELGSDDHYYKDLWKEGYDITAFNIAESIDFMKDQAKQQGKPLVVSLSQNSHGGWHNGTSNMATLLGKYCKDDHLALMLCTGNEGGDMIYVNQTLSAGDTLHLGQFPMYNGMGSTFCPMLTDKCVKLEFSIYDIDKQKVLYTMPVTLSSDDETHQELYFRLPLDDDANLSLKELMMFKHLKDYIKEGTVAALCYKTNDYDQNGDKFDYTLVEFYHSDIVWNEAALDEDGLPKLAFMIHLIPTKDTELHAWGENYGLFYSVNQEMMEYGTSDISMGDWNTSGEPVSVGAWTANNHVQYEDRRTEDTDDEIGDISWFSSYGTDLAGHQHPDVCAPGSYITAALNSFCPEAEDFPIYVRKAYTGQFVGQASPRNYAWGWKSGTSMSAPATAGIVALWMQAAADLGKTLDCNDIKDIIAHSSDTDDFTDKQRERFGCGKINAYKGLLYVLGLETAIQGLSMNQPENVTFRVSGDVLYADGVEDGTVVVLYNLSGVPVRQTTVQGGTVSLAGLQQGVYAVQLGKLGSTLIRK